MPFMNRRNFIQRSLSVAAALFALNPISRSRALAQLVEKTAALPLPTRELGLTGHKVTLFGLGGEGVLRTRGRARDAVPVIERAIDLGVNYVDTAPAYADSQDYYGAVFGNDPARRDKVFLAAKTHDRTRDGSWRLLEDSLERLRTDHLDLWQLHDLRTDDDLERVFAPGGTIEALREAKEQGLVKHFGITGHHDPLVLIKAAQRDFFDTALVALNAADKHSNSFARSLM